MESKFSYHPIVTIQQKRTQEYNKQNVYEGLSRSIFF